ncbi:GtrA family protein [Longispora sp. K20-0274]|uniref:GtrA family protein n=1 Tax=Longispora sp. K20-0274 TaxID=3088255 RepID=UPI00399A6157
MTTLARAAGAASRRSDVRYVLVGAVSFAIDASLLYVLHVLFGVWLPLATGLAFGSSVLFNFALNRLWSFGARRTVGRHFVRYAFLVAANWVLTLSLVPAITWAGVPLLVAKAGCTATLFAVNYVVSRYWIYR